MGETNSVSFMFDHIGLIKFDAKVADANSMFEAAIEAGAEDIESDEECHFIFTAIENLSSVREKLSAKFGDPQTAKFEWKAKNLTEISDLEQAQKLLKMIDALEDCDDVQNVTGNYIIAPSIENQL